MKTSIATGNERLLTLAKHLREGKLGHEVFDFEELNVSRNAMIPIPPKSCGTAGCAIGECPIAFPNDWEFEDEINPWPVLKDESSNEPLDDAARFFGLIWAECAHLFIPKNQDVDKFGGIYLGRDATKEQVADNIEAFVARRQKVA